MSVTVAGRLGGSSYSEVIRTAATGWEGVACAAGMVSWPRQGALGPRELSPLTDGWGQLPVAVIPATSPVAISTAAPRWPPARFLALNVHKAFVLAERGWAGSVEGPFQRKELFAGASPALNPHRVPLITCGQEGSARGVQLSY